MNLKRKELTYLRLETKEIRCHSCGNIQLLPTTPILRSRLELGLRQSRLSRPSGENQFHPVTNPGPWVAALWRAERLVHLSNRDSLRWECAPRARGYCMP